MGRSWETNLYIAGDGEEKEDRNRNKKQAINHSINANMATETRNCIIMEHDRICRGDEEMSGEEEKYIALRVACFIGDYEYYGHHDTTNGFDLKDCEM